MAFTFLHAADLHLDSPLRGLDAYEGAPVEQIRNATRRALENLVELAVQERVAFVVLAGDQYDGDWRDFNTGLFFVKQMARLKDAGIPVFAVAGNHDAASRLTKSLPLPDNVTLFPTDEAVTARLADWDVAVHGRSFADQCTTADLAAEYPAASPGQFNVGVLHTSLSGREGHSGYAPCSEACLLGRGYDYWALGHVHQREIVSAQPTIVFPGNVQGRHIRETGPKGAVVVRVADDRSTTLEFRPLDVFRWELAEVDAQATTSFEDALADGVAALRLALERADGLPLAARVVFAGSSPAHRQLTAQHQRLTYELRAEALNLAPDRLWVEQVKLKTAPTIAASTVDSLEGPWAEIAAAARELEGDPDARADCHAALAALARKLPSELDGLLPLDDPTWWSDVVAEAEAGLAARLGE